MKQLSISILIALALLFCGCHSAGSSTPTRPELPQSSTPTATVQEKTPPAEPSPDPGDTELVPENVNETGQLKGRAGDAEAAQKIADLYGITLVDCQNGLALFYTEEDPEDVIRRGRESGWPELTLNHTFTFW